MRAQATGIAQRQSLHAAVQYLRLVFVTPWSVATRVCCIHRSMHSNATRRALAR